MNSSEALSRFEDRNLAMLSRLMNSDSQARRQWEEVIGPAILENRVALIGEMEELGSDPTVFDGNPDKWFAFAELAPVFNRTGYDWEGAKGFAQKRGAQIIPQDDYQFFLERGVNLEGDGASCWVLGNGGLAQGVGTTATPFSGEARVFGIGGDANNRLRLSFRVEKL